MKFPKTIAVTIALSLALIPPVSSKTMRSTTGANLGEVKTTGEGKEDARLSIDAPYVSVKKLPMDCMEIKYIGRVGISKEDL